MTDQIPVIFVADQDNEVTAVLPTIPADFEGRNYTCYAHIGQHSSCSPGWFMTTRLARRDEYTPLLSELRSIYSDCQLVLVDKITNQHDRQRRNELKRI